jgi:hypothetical protein
MISRAREWGTSAWPLRAVLRDGRHLVLNTSDLFAEGVRDGRVVALPIREKATVAVRSQAAAGRSKRPRRGFLPNSCARWCGSNLFPSAACFDRYEKWRFNN